jgi:hypothetical protein
LALRLTEGLGHARACWLCVPPVEVPKLRGFEWPTTVAARSALLALACRAFKPPQKMPERRGVAGPGGPMNWMKPWSHAVERRRCCTGSPRLIRLGLSLGLFIPLPLSWPGASTGQGGGPFLCASAISWLFSTRRQALNLLANYKLQIARPNVRGNRAPTAGQRAPAGENVPCTTGRGALACRWGSG